MESQTVDTLDMQTDSQPGELVEPMVLDSQPLDSQPLDSQEPMSTEFEPSDSQPVEEPTDGLFHGSSSGIPDAAASMPPPPVPCKAAKKQRLEEQLEMIRRVKCPKKQYTFVDVSPGLEPVIQVCMNPATQNQTNPKFIPIMFKTVFCDPLHQEPHD